MLITWGKILQVLYHYIDSPMEVAIMRDNTDIWL